jgi:outer membrane lipoprotein-sorting protein
VGKKDQRGIAHLMLVVMVVLVAGAIGFVGWRVMSSQKDKDSNAKSSVSSASAVKENKQIESSCLTAIKDKDLCKFASRSSFDLNSFAYQADMSSTDKDGKKSEIISQVDGKNNTSMVTKENGAEVYSSVLLNNVMYTKSAGETTWVKFPQSSGSDSSQDQSATPANEVKFDTKDFTGENNNITYKALGKEKCGSLTCFKYQVIDKEQPNDEVTMWFDTKDYMIQRYSFKTSDDSSDIKFTYKNIKISEPSPVKDFTPESSAGIQAGGERDQ